MKKFRNDIRYAEIPNGEIMDDPTNMFIIGTGPIILVDPGSTFGLDTVTQILDNLGNPTVASILLTHVHVDHAESTNEIRRITGAPVRFHQLELPELGKSAHNITLDEPIASGEIIEHGEFRFEAMLTPGHSAGHLAFIEQNQGFGLVGDLVTGWGSSAVFPPWGNLADYIASMEAVADRGVNPLLPSHGEPVTNGPDALRHFARRRLEREAQILELLKTESLTVEQIRDRVYSNLPQDLLDDVSGNVILHLEKLEGESRLKRIEVDGTTYFTIEDRTR
ncbi:MAG: MBL fold metallo-hydrolase [Thermomicrobiaceae bacterium]